MSTRRTTTKSGTTKKRPRRHLLIIYGALIVFGVGLLIAEQRSFFRRPDEAPRDSTKSLAQTRAMTAKRSDRKTKKQTDSLASRMTLIDDDGQTLWASPTDGQPIDVAYLPPGVQIICAIRPESLADHSEGDKIFEAGGPLAKRGIEFIDNDLRSIAGVTQAIIGFSVDSSAKWSVTEVVHMSGSETATEFVTSEFPDAVKKSHNNQNYWLNGDRAYFAPSGDEQVLVVASPDAMMEIINLAGDPPPLRRDVERLLTHTDADRDVTIVVTPNSLFSEGRSMFEGEMTRLRGPLFWFLGDELSAAALSLDWGDNFFFELIATPTLDTGPEQAARILTERVNEIPDMLEAYVVGLDPQPYGRLVVARLPAMVRKLSTYTRSGFERDHAVLRGYLPAVAGHNLLMGAELTLAEQPVGARTVAEATAPSKANAGATNSVGEKLRRATTLRFARDTLEAALEQLSRDIGVAIVIRGPDLQADGITKNQSFGIDVENKPAVEVLIEILRLANPDKTAAGPNDVKQKLVYVVGPGEDGAEQIFVTTRAAVATRGEQLPAVFQTNP